MNALGDRGTCGAVSGGCADSVADVQPQTDDVVGYDVLVSGGAWHDSADSVAVIARQWLNREKLRTEISLRRAEGKPNARPEELENLRKKQRILEWLTGRADNG